jgi:hypothetical protein
MNQTIVKTYGGFIICRNAEGFCIVMGSVKKDFSSVEQAESWVDEYRSWARKFSRFCSLGY